MNIFGKVGSFSGRKMMKLCKRKHKFIIMALLCGFTF